MTSSVIWRGVSLLDGVTPIVVVATGLDEQSGNTKTGGMVQTWILIDRMHPKDAIDTGADAAICGDCPHRKIDGRRSCYVSLATGLSVVGRRVRDGVYPVTALDDAAELCRGRSVRLGAYGDPAAVPFEVWERLLRHAKRWTGYTHQWKRADRRLRTLLMASVDHATEHTWAELEGWRTFRVRKVDATGAPEPLKPGEIVCPASHEAGQRTTCERCGLCDGSRGLGDRRRAIAIVDHSTSALARQRRRLTVVAAWGK